MRSRLLIVGVAVIVVCGAGVIFALVDRTDGPSQDCLQVEHVVQPLGSAMPSFLRHLPSDLMVDADNPPDAAAAAASEVRTAASDIRAQAHLVQSPELRAKTHAIADALDRISLSGVPPSASTAPSKDYFAGTTALYETLHDIKKACPDILNDEVPPVSE
jgi:hypothetical protein